MMMKVAAVGWQLVGRDIKEMRCTLLYEHYLGRPVSFIWLIGKHFQLHRKTANQNDKR